MREKESGKEIGLIKQESVRLSCQYPFYQKRSTLTALHSSITPESQQSTALKTHFT